MVSIEAKEEWNKRLARAKNERLRCTALVAFNAAANHLKQLDLKKINAFTERMSSRDLDHIAAASGEASVFVDSPERFIAALAACMKRGRIMRFPASRDMLEWVADFFGEPDELQLGGWVGAVASQLAALGAEVVVYARPFSKKQAALFDSKIKSIAVAGNGGKSKKSKKLSFTSASKAGREGDATRENWVLRFNQGDSLRLGASFVTAPRSCSLAILESEGVQPFFDEEIEPALEVLGKRTDVALFSGFHSMRENKETQKHMALAIKHLKQLKSSKKILLHWEYNPFDSPALEKKFLKACAGIFDSIDVNEPELVYLLELLNCGHQAKEIEKQENSFNIFEGARSVLDKLKLKRVQVHSVGFHTIVLAKPYPVAPERVRDACLFASVVATTKALTGNRIVSLSDLKASSVSSVSDTGLNQLGVLDSAIAPELLKTTKVKFSSKMRRDYFQNGVIELKNCFALVVPAPIATAAKTTAGLGSVFSAAFVAKERS